MVLLPGGGWVRSGFLLPVQRLLCFNKHRVFLLQSSGSPGILPKVTVSN